MTDLSIKIKGFIESSFLDWPGQVASVIFLAGCNFRCPFCHNQGLVLDPDQYQTIAWEDVKERLSKFKGWIDGVIISGGEPTIDPGIIQLAEEIKQAGFMIRLDTNGSRPDVLASLIQKGLVDSVAMDVKAPLFELAYARVVGRVGFADKVAQSLELLRSSGLDYTIRTTVVPTLHTEENILDMAEQLKGVPEWKLQNFKPENAMDDVFRNLPAFTLEEFDGFVALAGSQPRRRFRSSVYLA